MTGGRHDPDDVRHAALLLPLAVTLGNLFFGVYAMVAAFRGDLEAACWYVVVAAVLDMLDGPVARLTRTGSSFGAELDSVVDTVSFGAAPALLFYVLYLQESGWSWLLALVYVIAVVVRLARFNVQQAGGTKSHFEGLPSPTAGIIVATFYPFSLTPFFEAWLAGLPWPQIVSVGIVVLSVLMVSPVPYRTELPLGLSDARELAGTALAATAVASAVAAPRYFFFLFFVLYTVYGLLRAGVLGALERLPGRDRAPDEGEDDGRAGGAGAELRRTGYREVAPGRSGGDAPADDPAL